MEKKITNIIENHFADILLEEVGENHLSLSQYYINLLLPNDIQNINQIIEERIGSELKSELKARKKIQLANLLSKIKNDFSSCGKTHITKNIISECMITKLVRILEKDISSCIESDHDCGYYILINQK